MVSMHMSEETWRAPTADFKGQIEEKETWNEKKKEGPKNVEANSCTMRGNRKSEQVLSLRELVKNV